MTNCLKVLKKMSKVSLLGFGKFQKEKVMSSNDLSPDHVVATNESMVVWAIMTHTHVKKG